MVERIRLLLKALGFWVWGLLAIALAASLANVGYRYVHQYRAMLASGRADLDTIEQLAANTSAKLSSKMASGSATAKRATKITDEAWTRQQLDAATRNGDVPQEIYLGEQLYWRGFLLGNEKADLVSRIAARSGCREGYAWASRAIDSEILAGRWAPMALYQMRADCSVQIDQHFTIRGDELNEAIRTSGGDLVSWSRYLKGLMQSQDFRSELSLYRILYLTGSELPEDEADYAANLYSHGFYGEAAAAYERAYDYEASLGHETLALELSRRVAADHLADQSLDSGPLQQLNPRTPAETMHLAMLAFEAQDYSQSADLFASVADDLPASANADDLYALWAMAYMKIGRERDAAWVITRMLSVTDLTPHVRDAWKLYVETRLVAP